MTTEERSSTSHKVDHQLFSFHTDSILSCDIDAFQGIAVTGGVDDTAFVFNYESREILFECSGHKESVNMVCFNCKQKLVATGDLSGFIQVYDISTKKSIVDYSIDEICWLQWHENYEYVLFAGTINGEIWMWNVKDTSAVKVFPSTGLNLVSAKILPDGRRLVVCYVDGSLKVFDLKTGETVLSFNLAKHNEVISIDMNSKGTVVAFGCADSTVKMVSIVGSGKLLATFSCKTPESILEKITNESEVASDSDGELDEDNVVEDVVPEGNIEVFDVRNEANHTSSEEEDVDNDEESIHENHSPTTDSVESLLFSACDNYLTAANISGSLVMWDVSSCTLRYEGHTGHRLSHCIRLGQGTYATGGLDGKIRVYDEKLQEIRVIKAHQDQILCMKSREQKLITGADDGTCLIKSI